MFTALGFYEGAVAFRATAKGGTMIFPFFHDKQWRAYRRRLRLKKILNFVLLGSLSGVGLVVLMWATEPERINAAAGVTPSESLLVDHIHTEQI